MSAQAAQLLFVDDEPNILEMLERVFSQHEEQWHAHYCQSVDEALTVLDEVAVDTIVTDARMPVKDGFHLLKAVRSSERDQHIPVIFLTGDSDSSLKRKALDLGATDLLNKPVHKEDLFARIRSALRLKWYEDQIAGQVETLDKMVKERTSELESTQREVVWRLAKACEYRDDETGNHVIRVAWYSRILAQALGKEEDYCDLLFLTSPLHDVGKIGIPDSILLKEGKLSLEERKIIEQHTVMGEAILSEKPKTIKRCTVGDLGHLFATDEVNRDEMLHMASVIAKGHHEKWNGTGYPNQIVAEDIPLACRIVAVADVYDALRSERPYKPAFPEEKVLAILQEESGEHFDPAVVAALQEKLSEIHTVNEMLKDN